MRKHYDVAVIGGGIFGVYSALFLADKGLRVLLLEKEAALLQKASIVNQARLHAGYHYPRSIATARMSLENKQRFEEEHQSFINAAFDKYYAIDRYGSLTDEHQFQRFCDYVRIPCKRIERHPHFNFNRIEALFHTQEFTFDPILIAQYYQQKVLAKPNVAVRTHVRISHAESMANQWLIQFEDLHNSITESITAHQVINATYAGSNTINALFGVAPIQLMHEISEMAFVTSPNLPPLGLTVMDGQFGSIMPYGLSGLWSLSSVAYTHHKVSYEKEPHFDCQSPRVQCQPKFLGNCNFCAHRPKSNQRKMIRQIKHYFAPSVDFHYYKSMFAIKSKLKANYIDDGRPTEISVLNDSPKFYCIFAGKINSIYEIEKVVV